MTAALKLEKEKYYLRFNENHDEHGRFASSDSSGGAALLDDEFKGSGSVDDPANINKVVDGKIKMTYVKVKGQNTQNYGSLYGQDIEPAGEYMSMDTLKGANKIQGFEYGTIKFNKPLIVDWKSTGANGWKKDLSEKYGGKTGKKLSNALKKDGYDAIITVDGGYPSEIVNLNGEKANGQRSLDFEKQKFYVRFNENHDEHGRFASSDGSGSSGSSAGGMSPSSAAAYGIEEITGQHPLGSLSKSDYKNKIGEADGLSSPDGEMKHITLYHGSFADFEEFDFEKGKEGKAGGADAYGEGFYFTADPEQARNYGDRIYTVDVAYSTNARVSKKTGREKDFNYDPDTGYWVIPKDKANNLKILGKEYDAAMRNRIAQNIEKGDAMKDDFEIRSYAFDLATEQTEAGGIITGRPIVYNSKTNLGMFDEIIERGALDNTDLRDVRFLVNHDTSKIPLARSRNNNANSTMQLIPDEKGLQVKVKLDIENNSEARNLYSAIKRGDVSGMSFMFNVPKGGDDWDFSNAGHPERRIKSISNVVEVSAVTFPAYADTEISVRNKAALDSAKATLDSVKKAQQDALESEARSALELAKAKFYAKIKM